MSTQQKAQPARKVIDAMEAMLNLFPGATDLSFRTADVRALIEYVKAREAGYDDGTIQDVSRLADLWDRLQDARRALGLGE